MQHAGFKQNSKDIGGSVLGVLRGRMSTLQAMRSVLSASTRF